MDEPKILSSSHRNTTINYPPNGFYKNRLINKINFRTYPSALIISFFSVFFSCACCRSAALIIALIGASQHIPVRRQYHHRRNHHGRISWKKAQNARDCYPCHFKYSSNSRFVGHFLSQSVQWVSEFLLHGQVPNPREPRTAEPILLTMVAFPKACQKWIKLGIRRLYCLSFFLSLHNVFSDCVVKLGVARRMLPASSYSPAALVVVVNSRRSSWTLQNLPPNNSPS